MVLVLGACVARDPSPREAGRPVIRNFAPREYEAHNPVFFLTEGANGLMYFAVYGNVLEFDGQTWRKIPDPTSWVRGLAATDAGIHVAATDELGLCQPGPDGLPVYQSCVSRLPARLAPVGPVWSTAGYEGAVWFSASRFVARFQGDQVQVWDFPAPARATLPAVNGTLVLRRIGDAQYRWQGRDAFVRMDLSPRGRATRTSPPSSARTSAPCTSTSSTSSRNSASRRGTPPCSPRSRCCGR